MKEVKVDYNDCLTNLSNSLLKYFDVETKHSTLKDIDEILENKKPKNVIVLLYDGMGSNILERNLDKNSFLRVNKLRNFCSVFPPTTTAATTSLQSALNPVEHGWLGWDLYFKDEDKIVTMFLNTIKDTEVQASEENLAKKYYGFENIIKSIKEKHDAYGLFPFGENAYESLDDMNERIIELTKQDGKKLIYAYSDEPDHTCHEKGTSSLEVIELYKTLNYKTEELCNNLEDSIVIVIADHGHIDVTDIVLKDYPDIFNMLTRNTSIEGRACNFFVQEEKKDEFIKLFNEYFGKDFKLYTKEQVIENNIFGTGKSHERFEDSLGDFLAIGITNKYFRYDENSVLFKSTHAGSTDEEVYIPLIVINK